ncbi:HBL005Cp [Eremothecium sinecaudum]|uniref:HBL005Cp n=1 Tax=Eremothecium sinecaudum TaxID=45286 RepID=A0A109UX25_9SACH|nr:HBL005Cp [Eremothecium sinecaudum]AMD18897.1 HBL005Cp [Eremothecium sinecaudum]
MPLREKLKVLLDGVFELREENGMKILPIFYTLPLRKDYPDYYKIIKKPLSLATVKKRLNHYEKAQEFVIDLVRITWNARTYNTKESEIYHYALIMDRYIREHIIPQIEREIEHVTYPYLGPLPDEQPLPGVPIADDDDENTSAMKDESVVPEIVEEKDATADEEDQEASVAPDDEEDDEYREKKRVNKLRLPNITPTPSAVSKSTTPQPSLQRHQVTKAHTRRGRPPVIDLPFEQRIKNVLKNLKREFLSATRELLTSRFDKLPDEEREPQYYTVISNPLSLDDIKKRIKQRKYKDFQGFENDIRLMLNNYRMYHRSQPQEMRRAAEFETKFNEFAKYELSRPDEDFMTDGELKYPLNQIELNGKTYKIGDWILLRNPNDETKPTVAQIFRFWHTNDGRRWLNCCWYLRPEQTVHRVDRLFYKNEVVKSGQYRDHLVEEIIGKCYVCHFTRYQRGDPDLELEGPLFVCEYRYNESEKVFNKIRTWKGCLPEEVRDIEEPTFPVIGRKFFKYESPIKHLLPPNATVNSPIPQPTEGVVNAPPLVGAVYLRPKVKKDDLGEYSTSDDCPRYIIRPGDPPEPGKINSETGTIITNSQTASVLPKMNMSTPRLSSLNRNGSYSSLVGRNGSPTSLPRSTQYFPPVPNGDLRTLPIVQQVPKQGLINGQVLSNKGGIPATPINSNATSGTVNGSTPAYQPPSIINNLAAQARTNNSVLGNIVVDTPGAYTLPLSITKNVEVLQRTDYNNQVRRLGKEQVPKKRKYKGEVLWFKGASVVCYERLLNSGGDMEVPLNRWFKKRRKLDYEEVDEEVGDGTQIENGSNDDYDDSQDEQNELPGTFPMGLRPSAKYMSYKICSGHC